MGDEIRVAYLEDKSEKYEGKIILRKFIICSPILLFGLYLGIVVTPIIIAIAIIMIMIISFVSYFTEIYLKKFSFLQIVFTLFLQLIIPPLVMAIFDRIYGLLILTCFGYCIIFTIIDMIIRIRKYLMKPS